MAYRIQLNAHRHYYYVYSGQSLLVTNRDGEITGHSIEGFYMENIRLLSCDKPSINGKPLKIVAVSPVGSPGLLAYAEIPVEQDEPEPSVYLEISRWLSQGMQTRLHFENYSVQQQPARFELALPFAADFADLEEAKEGKRQQLAEVLTNWDADKQELLFSYCHPKLQRAVAIRVVSAPSPPRFKEGEGQLLFSLELSPHQPVEIDLTFEPIFEGQRRQLPAAPTFSFSEITTSLGRLRHQIRQEMPRLSTTNSSVVRAWNTAVSDLASLPLGLDEGPAAPIAGLPFYQQFFGRDTLTIGWQALMATPTLLRDSLRVNAAWQGTDVNNWRDEEPGRIIHQARTGPLSLLNLDPFLRYYGDYAAPQDFLIMLGQYLWWTNDRATVLALLPAARKVVEWLEHSGDLDGDGFLEYVTRSAKGLKNQGWKDSGNAIVDEHGSIVENPIATSEIQAYWYVGLQQAALAFLMCGEVSYGLKLLGKARALKRRFDRAFWMEKEGFYALALGPDKRQVASISSNTGHLLATGIVPVAKGYRVAQRMMQADLFSGWGIRTLSSLHPAYHPFSYHLGSVWPVENGTFAFGFARYGCWEELHRLAQSLFEATELFEENRLPEVLGGIARDQAHPHPGIYPHSNEPQGWSASAVILVIQALLGLFPLAPLHLLLVDPHLPPWLPELRLEGLRVGQAYLDLEFWRTRQGATRYRVRRREGFIRVVQQPPPQSPQASLEGRLFAGLKSLPRL